MTAADDFGFGELGLDPVDNGTSLLLTGEDADALETVFYRLVATPDEQAVVLATDTTGSAVNRKLEGVHDGASERTHVLASQGVSRDENVDDVDDIGDLTTLGMEFSTRVAEGPGREDRFRAGLLLCSSVCAAVDDTRSVYRFLNSNFLNHFRRNDAIGVCAVDTSADIGSDVRSTVKGMETSFTGRVHVAEASRREATLELSGVGDEDTVTVAL